ncbi:RICIN domain-containing protein [Streptomyces vietnamensis]|uniref:RICIN domain-containing protein n=1 Tax=Streptomyces vietnamensis TaxID=362257 RepID=UPI003436B276
MVNGASGTCVDLPYSATAPGTEPMLYTCHGGANQRWTFTMTGKDGVCLDGAGTTVQPCNGSAGQQWQLGTRATITSGGRCLAPVGSGTANGERRTANGERHEADAHHLLGHGGPAMGAHGLTATAWGEEGSCAPDRQRSGAQSSARHECRAQERGGRETDGPARWRRTRPRCRAASGPARARPRSPPPRR